MSGNYPAEVLPPPSSRSYSFNVEPVVRREQMDSGRYRQVRLATSQYHFVSLSWELTDQELQMWKGFYNVVANQASEFFTIDLAFGGGVKTNVAQFVGGYSVSNRGSFNWSVSAPLQLETIDEIDNQTDLETAGAPLGLVAQDWLTALPNVQVSYSFDVESATARTGMNSASYVNRKRNQRNVHIVGVEWSLDDDQMEFFKGWHRVILEFGSIPFEMDLAFGDGYKASTARFVEGSFQATMEGHLNWRVSAQLECDKVEEINTYAEYLSELVERQNNIPLRQPQALGAPGSGTGEVNLEYGQGESEDFQARGVLSVPLFYGDPESQDFKVNQINYIPLADGDGEET